MNTGKAPAAEDELERALDAALARTLGNPGPSAAFRERLRAALARAGSSEPLSERADLERELREQLAELQRGYLRLRRRTLVAIIGGAFAAGGLTMVLLPWLQSQFGSGSIIAVPLAGAVVGLAIGASQVIDRVGSLRP
jgi:hypothetical protein